MAFRLSNVNIQKSTFTPGKDKTFTGWEKESEREFQKRVARMETMVRAEMPTVIRNASKDTVKQLVKVTPIGKGRTRGFAKAGWGNAMLSLNIQPRGWFFRGSGPRGERWRDFGGHVDNLKHRNKPTYSLINNVPYIQEMKGSSAVVPRAYRNSVRIYDKRLARMAKRMEKRWSR